MVVWGSQGQQVNLGLLEERYCETCERQRPFMLMLAYTYFHLYWIFRCVTKRKYWMSCEVCSHGWELETKTIEAHLMKYPIPRVDRFGLAAFLGAPLIVVAVFSIFGF
jgi:hypothetical protein